MALICLITFANVVTRYLSNYSFAFTEEFSVFLLVVLSFLGASAAFGADRHIRMSFFTRRLPSRWADSIEAGLSLLAVALFGTLVWYGLRLSWDDWRHDTTSPGMGLPQWIYSIWLPVLSVLIVMRLLGHAVRAWRGRR
jgi:TRAP-type C4-dicarboxylate transport system permease small subunit